jgi:dihydropteroate synthase
LAGELVRIRPAVTTGGRPVIIGVLNVTPDSFSDGGDFVDPDAAIARAVQLRSQGADLIDIGGESTRPGAERVDPELELSRILPVITGMIELGIPVSVDTMNSATARSAIKAGARVINDVSGGLADPEMYRLVAQTGVRYIASHWRGHSDSMDDLTNYDDVAVEVRDALKARIAELLVWGVQPEQIVIDPGLGFAKTGAHNWQILSQLGKLESLGYPVLIGASRKRFLAPFAPDDAPAAERDFATAIVTALAADRGVWGVRVHDVATTVTALDLWSAIEHGGVDA